MVLVNMNYRIGVHMNFALEFLRWSVARNQNTIATRLVASGGTTRQCHHQFQSFQVNKIFDV